MTTWPENQISRKVVRCAIEVHRRLGGSGLLESIYEEAIAWELSQTDLQVARQVNVPICYRGNILAAPAHRLAHRRQSHCRMQGDHTLQPRVRGPTPDLPQID